MGRRRVPHQLLYRSRVHEGAHKKGTGGQLANGKWAGESPGGRQSQGWIAQWDLADGPAKWPELRAKGQPLWSTFPGQAHVVDRRGDKQVHVGPADIRRQQVRPWLSEGGAHTTWGGHSGDRKHPKRLLHPPLLLERRGVAAATPPTRYNKTTTPPARTSKPTGHLAEGGGGASTTSKGIKEQEPLKRWGEAAAPPLAPLCVATPARPRPEPPSGSRGSPEDEGGGTSHPVKAGTTLSNHSSRGGSSQGGHWGSLADANGHRQWTTLGGGTRQGQW